MKQPQRDALLLIQQAVAGEVPEAERGHVQVLIGEPLRWLHEGVLERYELRPSELAAWKTH